MNHASWTSFRVPIMFEISRIERSKFGVFENIVIMADLLRSHFRPIKLTMREREHSNSLCSREHKKIFLHHRCPSRNLPRRCSRGAQNRIHPTSCCILELPMVPWLFLCVFLRKIRTNFLRMFLSTIIALLVLPIDRELPPI